MKLHFLLFIFFSCSASSWGKHNYLKSIEIGEYDKIIKNSESIKTNKNLQELTLLADSYSTLNQQEKTFEIINLIGSLNSRDALLTYHSWLSFYYQQMLNIDSCLHHAILSVKLIEETHPTDSSIISYAYMQYANAMRNGDDSLLNRIELANEFDNTTQRFIQISKWFQNALKYAQTDNQRADIYRKKGIMFSDGTSSFPEKGSPYENFADSSIFYLRKSLLIERSPADRSVCYGIIGLNYFYLGDHAVANEFFMMALAHTKEGETIVYPSHFVGLTDWCGLNYDQFYQQTKDDQYLYKANAFYQLNLVLWRKLFQSNNFHDAYHYSAINRLILNHILLFESTGDTSHLNVAFNYAEESKYPDLYDSEITFSKIQALLDDKTAYVNCTAIGRPTINLAFIISKNDINIIITDSLSSEITPNALNNLYSFDNFSKYKNLSYLIYQNYFKDIDSVLKSKEIKKIIISNSDQMSLLNLDILIRDTVGEKWKTLNYLYLDYNISYTLNAGSYIKAINRTKPTNKYGISVGKYKTDANLRFSKKLKDEIITNYNFFETNLTDNLSYHDICLLFYHGDGSYNENEASFRVSSDVLISASDISRLNLSNELIILSACNTNASNIYFGEGAIGSFNQAFLRAGCKSAITTSWAIDEKVNSYIMGRFIAYLSIGLSKNNALWLAKKDYWDNADQDEEFKPLYWAPYVLTGSVNPVFIKKKNTNYYTPWLALLFILPFVFFIKYILS